MEFLASNGFGSLFYAVCAGLTIQIVCQGYYKNRFFIRLARTVSIALVLFTIFYLSYRFGTGYTGEVIGTHTSTNYRYVWVAGLHGALSFIAIIQTCTLLYLAEKAYKQGRNYFTEHPHISLVLVILWPIALLSGILI